MHWVVEWKDMSMGRNTQAGKIYQVLRTKGEVVTLRTMGLDEYCQEPLIIKSCRLFTGNLKPNTKAR